MSAARFIEICAREHSAILAGQLDALDRLANEKQLALAAITGAGADDLNAARQAAADSARLLGAAQTGIARARARLAALSRPPSLRTYDAAGTAREISAPPGTLARRA
ncbi:hypothetical protein [Anianabacter salinae]|uniref:hypothetical protein n=1 Tax=Anianabacter salinae TaxID=2851023 RepID=UPI00225E4395|nr:hypothetical protein [Anianabacter salinae]MBV0913441.1 hypothetical protein [Anianabacter salinae]